MTFVVPFITDDVVTVAVMLWLPGVLKLKPLGQVYEPASAAVNWWSRGRTAAGSELVKCIALLIDLSRLPLTIAVTVTVKGEPVIAVEGALTTRYAAGVPQPNVTNPATDAINAHRRSTTRTSFRPPRADLPEYLGFKCAEPACALNTLTPNSGAHSDEVHRYCEA